MEDEVKEFLELILKNVYALQDVQKIAKRLLWEDFRKEVCELWRGNINNCYNQEYTLKQREFYKKCSKVEFIKDISYDTEKMNFVNEHWDQIENILLIIRDYIADEEGKEKSKNE